MANEPPREEANLHFTRSDRLSPKYLYARLTAYAPFDLNEIHYPVACSTCCKSRSIIIQLLPGIYVSRFNINRRYYIKDVISARSLISSRYTCKNYKRDLQQIKQVRRKIQITERLYARREVNTSFLANKLFRRGILMNATSKKLVDNK